MKTLVGLIVARPLIAIALAVVVVAVLYLGFTHRQTTPVTHRTEHVRLTDKEQMELGSEEYAKTLRQYRRRIVSSGAAYAEVQRVAKRIEAVAGRDKPGFVWRVTLLRKNVANAYCLPGGKIVVRINAISQCDPAASSNMRSVDSSSRCAFASRSSL